MKYPRLKSISVTQDGKATFIELFEVPPTREVITHDLPMTDLMPPDDVMLFAATEDPEEVMEDRKSE